MKPVNIHPSKELLEKARKGHPVGFINKYKEMKMGDGSWKYVGAQGKNHPAAKELFAKLGKEGKTPAVKTAPKKSPTSMLDAARKKQRDQEAFDEKTLQEQALPGSRAYERKQKTQPVKTQPKKSNEDFKNLTVSEVVDRAPKKGEFKVITSAGESTTTYTKESFKQSVVQAHSNAWDKDHSFRGFKEVKDSKKTQPVKTAPKKQESMSMNGEKFKKTLMSKLPKGSYDVQVKSDGKSYYIKIYTSEENRKKGTATGIGYHHSPKGDHYYYHNTHTSGSIWNHSKRENKGYRYTQANAKEVIDGLTERMKDSKK